MSADALSSQNTKRRVLRTIEIKSSRQRGACFNFIMKFPDLARPACWPLRCLVSHSRPARSTHGRASWPDCWPLQRMRYPPVSNNAKLKQGLNRSCCEYVALDRTGCDLIEVAAGATICRHRTSTNSAKAHQKGQIGSILAWLVSTPGNPLCRSQS